MKFSVCQVRRILSNPIYICRARYGGNEIYDPNLAMIIPENRFKMVQTFLVEKATKRWVKKVRKPRSIFDEWARKFGLDYVTRVLDVVKVHCRKCRGIMVGNGSKPVGGQRLPRFKCTQCGHQQIVPLGSQLECFQGADLLICPNSKCRAVENFEVRQLVDGSWEYMCRDCGLSFRSAVPSDKSSRKLSVPDPSRMREPERGKRKSKRATFVGNGKFKTLEEF